MSRKQSARMMPFRNLTTDGVALMPDCEITRGRMLECLSERGPPEEVVLMDRVFFEEVIGGNKMH